MSEPAHPAAGLLRGALLAVAVALPIVPVVLGLGLSSGSSASAPNTPNVDGFRPTASAPSTSSAPSRKPPPGQGVVVAVITRGTMLRAAPGGRVISRIGTRTNFGSPTVLWAPESRPGWLGVISSLAGNNRLGWVSDRDAQLSRVNWELHVSLAARRLTVIQSGRVVKRYTVAVGRSSAPTPTGRFSVSDLLSTGDPAGPYGCCILALSARSPHAIQGWSGGNRIAIHSTPDPSAIGQPVSHGCVRVTLAEGRWLLYHIPLGTPTLISTA